MKAKLILSYRCCWEGEEKREIRFQCEGEIPTPTLPDPEKHKVYHLGDLDEVGAWKIVEVGWLLKNGALFPFIMLEKEDTFNDNQKYDEFLDTIREEWEKILKPQGLQLVYSHPAGVFI